MAVLWMIQAVNLAAVVFYGFWTEPGAFGISSWIFIPCLIGFLSVVLKGSANRWMNFILGILTVIMKLRFMIEGFEPGGIAFRFNELWGLIGAILIVWYAWRWPKQEAKSTN